MSVPVPSRRRAGVLGTVDGASPVSHIRGVPSPHPSTAGRLLLLVIPVVVVVAGCGRSADQPYAALTVHDAPSGAYRLRYLSPPWKLQRTDGDTTEVVVDAPGVPFLSLDAGAPLKYDLVATVQPGNARSVARQDTAAALSRGEVVATEATVVQTDSGATGLEVLTTVSSPVPRNFLYVSLDSARGVVHLAFEATPSLDEAEVSAMVQAVDVDVTP